MKTPASFHIAIEASAPVHCRQQIQIAAPIDEVWAVLTEIGRWSAWQSDITRTKVAGGIAPGTRFTWKTGGMTIQSELHTVHAGRAFGWTGRAMAHWLAALKVAVETAGM